MARRKINVATDIGEVRGDQPASIPDSPARVFVPRRWLFALAALLIVPWLVAGLLYWRESSGQAAGPKAAIAGEATTTRETRPWGQLATTPIVISPPLDYVPSNWGPIQPPEWRFPQINRENLERFLGTGGLICGKRHSGGWN